MKKRIAFLVFGTIFAASALADQARRPVLSYKSGGILNKGVVKTCTVYSDHPSLAGAGLKNLDLLIRNAQASPLQRGSHIRATVPSIEYTAYVEVSTRRGPEIRPVVILEDASDIKYRVGDAAEKLTKSIDDEFCR